MKRLLPILMLSFVATCGYAQKWVKTDFADLKNGDVIIIADLSSCVAMKNTIKDKSMDVHKIEFNDAQTEIITDISEGFDITWKIEIIGSDYVFYVPNTENKSWFYCNKSDNYVLLRKTNSASNVGLTNTFVFDEETGYLTSTGLDMEDGEQRKIGVYLKEGEPYEWRSYTTTKNIKNTKTAFFRYENDVTSCTQIEASNEEVVNVYNLAGQCLKMNVGRQNALDDLPKGVYIVGEKRCVKR
jgi:hypothetical protein